MFRNVTILHRRGLPELAVLLAGVVASGIFVATLPAQTTPVSKPAAGDSTPTRYQPNRQSRHAAMYYSAVWGVDGINVKAAESGELIRFSYQVLDPDKAKALNDKTNSPFLIAPAVGIRLSVPSLEKVGQLRQSSTPEAGKSYWMAFSNPGRRVKRGDRVDVVIGQFRAEGLFVE
jgi:hypothetical protein